MNRLQQGSTISHYQVLDQLGQGGMGVVYRAEDTKLHREVALKVLSSHLLSSEDDRARFYREARSAAALNHPNIATVYAVDEAVDSAGNPQPFIAMEMIEGRTLREMIDDGPLKLEDAIRITREIATALQVAHEKDIVHRDVKSANVMVTTSGAVKVLDFGLAKTAQSTMLTRTGSTLGTAAYMSPEQTASGNVDRRTDLWSLGVVLYEMVAGRLPFDAGYEQAMMYAIVNEEPEALTAVRTGVPIELDRIVGKCLMKDPKLRYQHADDLVADLTAIELRSGSGYTVSRTTLSTTSLGAVPGRTSRSSRTWIIAGLVGLVGIVLGAIAASFLSPSEPPLRDEPYRLSILLPDGVRLPRGESAPLSINRRVLALSPDGTRLAFLGWDGERTMLYARPLSEFDREPLAGTEGAYGPFFSPDGEWVAFFAGEELKKVPFDGSSSPLSLGPVSLPYYGLWGPDDWIYFRNNEGVQLARISAAGGDIRVLRSRLYAVTDFLPGNRVMGTTFVGDRTEIGTEPMDAAGFTGLGIRGTWPVLIEGNELAFARGGHLFTVAVDPETTQPTGQPRQIVGGIWSDADRQQVSVSRSGIVAYVPGPRENRTRFVFVDRAGNREVLPFDPQEYGMFQLSPDGSKIVVHRPTSVVEEDLWVFDVDRSTVEQISRVGSNFYPAWTVAADAVLGQSCRSGECVAKLFPVGRSGSPTVIVDANVSPSDATTIEGREVVVAGSQAGLIAVFLDGSDRIDTLVTQPASIWGPSVSPDGRFMAYTSNITQQYEVWVEPFPDTGRRWQASLGGGEEPKWSVDGKELIYRLGQRLYAVDVTVAGDEPRFGEPRVVYEGPFYNVFGLSYDVAPDGRFLVLEPAEETGDLREIRVMKGW